MRGDMWEPPVAARWVYTRKVMVGYPGSPPRVIRQWVVSIEEEAEDGTDRSS